MPGRETGFRAQANRRCRRNELRKNALSLTIYLFRPRYVEYLGEWSEMPIEKSDLLQGTLDMLILKIVALGPVHGYGISQRIRQISKEVLHVQQGSLYPALHRLEKRGWLAAEWGESENGRQAKFYKLSAKGRRQLASEESNWNRLAEAVMRILETVQ
jgi:PadR family transcriptional regulator PadR